MHFSFIKDDSKFATFLNFSIKFSVRKNSNKFNSMIGTGAVLKNVFDNINICLDLTYLGQI